MRRMRIQNEQGKWRTDVVVFDHPETPWDIVADDGFPVTDDGKPGVGFPGVGSPGVTNKTESKTPKTSRVDNRPVSTARDWESEPVDEDVRARGIEAVRAAMATPRRRERVS